MYNLIINLTQVSDHKKLLENDDIDKSCFDGKRITEYLSLGLNLWCNVWNLPLSLLDIMDERLDGYASILDVKCKICNTVKKVETQKKCMDNKYFVKNVKMPLGTGYFE